MNGALQWLEDNQDKDFEQIKAVDATSASGDAEGNSASASNEEPVANSLVCDECGKRFKNADLAQFHAAKSYVYRRCKPTCIYYIAQLLTYKTSGHENFSQSTEEIKPLTDDEKKAKLEELRQLAATRKAAQEIKDKEAAKKNEVCHRTVAPQEEILID